MLQIEDGGERIKIRKIAYFVLRRKKTELSFHMSTIFAIGSYTRLSPQKTAKEVRFYRSHHYCDQFSFFCVLLPSPISLSYVLII